MKIGYVPLSAALDQPGDLRRFCHYAKRKGLAFEIADPLKHYDLVVVTHGGDITTWARRRPDEKLVYDFIDSYLAVSPWRPKNLLRGLAKFATRQTRYLALDYRRAIVAMCRRADAVICATEEQEAAIRQHCSNVHRILDIHSSVARVIKDDYRAHTPFRLVWEGVPENVGSFETIAKTLRGLAVDTALELHLVTRPQYRPFMGRYGFSRDTAAVARRHFPNIVLHEWKEETAGQRLAACDLAVIPIALDDALARGKPENKLLLLWRVGLPVLASGTLAYRRAMDACGLPMACEGDMQWRDALKRYMGDEAARRDAARIGRAYAESRFGEEALIAQWDALLASVGFGVRR